jgi:hypothetical protein
MYAKSFLARAAHHNGRASTIFVLTTNHELWGSLVQLRYGSEKRPWTFYVLAAFFTLFVLFLYGPMCAIYLLSFQGPNGGLTFPMHGVSLQWFAALFV